MTPKKMSFLPIGILFTILLAVSAVERGKEVQLELRARIDESQILDKIDLLLLLDESESLSSYDFQQEKSAALNIIDAYARVGDIKVGIITFGDKKTTIVQNPSKNLETSKEAIKGLDKDTSPRPFWFWMKDPNEPNLRNHLPDALKEAETMFGHTREGSRRVIFVITDGKDMPDESIRIADKLKFIDNVMIFGIGVGNGDKKDMTRLTSAGFYFEVNNFEELKEATASLIAEQHSNRREIIFQPFLLDLPLSFSQDISLRLRIANVGGEDIPANSVIYFKCPTNYLVKHSIVVDQPIPSHQDITIYATVPVSGSATVKSVPEYIDLEMFDPVGRKVYSEHSRILLSSEFFIKDFENDISNVLNILVFGCIGAGKTSWVNAMLTALSPQVINRGIVGDLGGHSTEDLVKFSLWEGIEGIPQIKINFWDTWGVTPDNYEDEGLFPSLLAGELPEGYHMKQRTALNELKNLSGTPTPFDGVLLFVPWDIMQDKALTSKMHQIFRVATKKGFNPLIIVTHIDKLEDANLRLQIKTDLARLFRISENRIHLVSNYVSEQVKNFHIDKMNLMILDEIVRIASGKASPRSNSILESSWFPAMITILCLIGGFVSGHYFAKQKKPKKETDELILEVKKEDQLQAQHVVYEEDTDTEEDEIPPLEYLGPQEKKGDEEENIENEETKEEEAQVVEEKHEEEWVDITSSNLSNNNSEEQEESEKEETDSNHKIVEVKVLSGASRQFRIGKTTTIASLLSQSVKVFASPDDKITDFYLADQKGAILVENDIVWENSSPLYLNKHTSA